MIKTITTNVAVIGAGPVGLFSVFECGLLGMKCHVIDILPEIGGQCTALYPEKPIYDIPGFCKITGTELIDNLQNQIAPFSPTYQLNSRVERVDGGGDAGFSLICSDDRLVTCKAVIIAAGAGAFGPNRPPIKNLENFEGVSVFYMVKRRDDFKGKKIVIAGGGDSAVDWAVSLSEVAKKITVVHRRDKFRAAPDMVQKMQDLAVSGNVEICTPYQLKDIDGDDTGKMTHVTLANINGGDKEVEADILLPLFGLASKIGPIEDWGLNLEKGRLIVDNSNQKTNRPGVYAIGDIAQYKGKYKLILQGFSEAAVAAHDAYSVVFPEKALHFEHSTSHQAFTNA